MSPSSQTIVSKGIFRGLPTFPDHEGKKYNIIVTGANGISGSYLLKVLAEAPERWGKVYAMSRRPVEVAKDDNGQVVPIAVDFLDSTPEEIAKVFKEHNVQADYAFFGSYVQTPPKEGQGLWSDTEGMTRDNIALLSNFLQALELVPIKPKRFLMQHGGKYYGIHLGPAATPEREDDPRHGIEPNFYFPMEDMLWDYSARTGVEWVVTRPSFILGATATAAMNIIYPLAVYAAIQAYLGRKLDFPGDVAAWEISKDQSTAKLIGYHAEWALLTPEAGNKALNISDDSPFTFGRFWPKLAAWYGIETGLPVEDPDKYSTFTMPAEVPPRGFGGPGVVKTTFSFLEWSKRPEVLKAWEEIKEKYNLQGSPFGDKALDTFGLIDGEVSGPWGRINSMNRNHKLGWHGWVDTEDSIDEVIKEMEEFGVVPPMRKH